MKRILVAVLAGATLMSSAAGEDATAPGELMIDDATCQSLAFRWLIRGDDNGNGVVTVKYRKKGSEKYRDAMPLLRVNRETVDREHDPFRCGNLFAGSILFLESATEYEIAFTLTDPDGGGLRVVAARVAEYDPAQQPLPWDEGVRDGDRVARPADIVGLRRLS